MIILIGNIKAFLIVAKSTFVVLRELFVNASNVFASY